MPRENKHSRGRRSEKKEQKRKREDGEDETNEPKRQKSQDPENLPEDVDFIGLDNSTTAPEGGPGEGTAGTERPFYGMLEDEEQEYFRRADELLELNDFPSAEERTLFLENVYREAESEELKLACSQSCSRLMERLILLSTSEQKKKLYEKFAGNFAHLVQHRFASHCCETLFIQSAPVVTEELAGGPKKKNEEEDEGEANASMESLFLATLDELEGQMSFLLTDRFASHTLRVLLVILSGRPLDQSSTNSLLQSKKKEKIAIANMDNTPSKVSLGKRVVPESFQFAVEKIISDTIATMDPSFIRVLATHPTGNPTLQLLLELELTNPNTKKGSNAEQKTIISALLPDDIGTEGSSSIFINGILYDPIGSRLLETICSHAPGKLFKQIYRTTFKERIASLARNEISSYAVIRVLNRLSKEDLEEAVENITPQIAGLVERSRTVIIKTLLERCHTRKSEKSVKSLTDAIASAYGSDPSTLALKMSCIDDIDALTKAIISPPAAPAEEVEAGDTDEKKDATSKAKAPQTPAIPKPTPQQTHGSLLAQSMLALPGAPSALLQTSLLALSPSVLLTLAIYKPTSHILQSALQAAATPPTFRRKLLNALLFSTVSSTSEQEQEQAQDPALTLALSATGSHTLDAILLSTASTSSLFTLTERVAQRLTTHESTLRDSFTGRIVWRNWFMDLFNRRRGDWVNKIKTHAASLVPQPSTSRSENTATKNEGAKQGKKAKKSGSQIVDTTEDSSTKPAKSAIQLAREKFAAKKLAQGPSQFKPKAPKQKQDSTDALSDQGNIHPSRKIAAG
ncbi:ARM repeat-containing protein [Venustampulla echinocandica]|uniref:Nucleolar protein 9 n=1 Tax=Venustampulla echinocandica TaxID=2656787 RepID=A0A370TDP9_9HELO|nr:ARM repeat-containing protein [Venustampulla echinocandica]RDL32589.1 ARM repeat-containing protein [Venustampulla echinocandica]